MTHSLDDALVEKVVCGLRQITASMAQDTLSSQRAVQTWQDRVNGFARELEDAVAMPPLEATGVAELREEIARLRAEVERLMPRYAQPCFNHEYVMPGCPNCGKIA